MEGFGVDSSWIHAADTLLRAEMQGEYAEGKDMGEQHIRL